MKLSCTALVLLLAGCASGPPPLPGSTQPATPPERGAQPAPAKPPALAAEQRWLAALFEGTPVRVSADAEGGVRLRVPLQYAFDVASSDPKPPLRAVLDRLGLRG